MTDWSDCEGKPATQWKGCEECSDIPFRQPYSDTCMYTAPWLLLFSEIDLIANPALDPAGFTIDGGAKPVTQAQAVFTDSLGGYDPGWYVVIVTDSIESSTTYTIEYSGSDLESVNGIACPFTAQTRTKFCG